MLLKLTKSSTQRETPETDKQLQSRVVTDRSKG